MDIRKFEAFTMSDALKAIRKEMGRDAVILSSRERKADTDGSGQLRTIYEVVAAPGVSSSPAETPDRGAGAGSGEGLGVGSNPGGKKPSPAAAARRNTMGRVLAREDTARIPTVAFPTLQPREEMTLVKDSTRPIPSRNAPRVGINPQTKRLADALAEAMEKKNPSPLSQATPTGALKQSGLSEPAALERLPSGEVQWLREELQRVRLELESLPHVDVADKMAEIKVMLHELLRQQSLMKAKEVKGGHLQGLNPFVADIGVKLRTAGVLPACVAEMEKGLQGVEVPKGRDGIPLDTKALEEFWLGEAIRRVLREVKITGEWNIPKGSQKVICLVGPTGVGKTTTLAKLAAWYRLKKGLKVALCSLDNWRIGAQEQLRSFARILGVEFGELSGCAELQIFLRRNPSVDLVLLDTAGRSARNINEIDNLKDLQQGDMAVEFHLMMSCTMKQRDIDETLLAWRSFHPKSILFSKLDESWSFGEIFNTCLHSRIPLSWFATGQRVPEDLEVAQKERVIERLFRL